MSASLCMGALSDVGLELPECVRVPGERWRRIALDPRYLVSDLGRVVRESNLWVVRTGSMNKKHGGYPRLTIAGKARLVHLLVLETFVGPCPEGHEANHEDGNHANAKLSNLSWVTRAYNQEHATRTGLRKHLTGEAHPNAKVTRAQAEEIRRRYAVGDISMLNLGYEYGITRGAVDAIVKGKVWR